MGNNNYIKMSDTALIAPLEEREKDDLIYKNAKSTTIGLVGVIILNACLMIGFCIYAYNNPDY